MDINKLLKDRKQSIEHVLPKDVLCQQMQAKYPKFLKQHPNIFAGATTNLFNMAASHQTVNKMRECYPFDLDGDGVKHKPLRFKGTAAYKGVGLDEEHEWIVPNRSKGDVARAMIYMSIMYRLNNLYPNEVATLKKWALHDPPSAWEKAYNNWVKSLPFCKGYNNPLIENQKLWLQDSVLVAITNADENALDEARGEVTFNKGPVTVVAILPDPRGRDEGAEEITFGATGKVTGRWRIEGPFGGLQELKKLPSPGNSVTVKLTDGPTLPNSGGRSCKFYLCKYDEGSKKWLTMLKAVYPKAEAGKWIKFAK
mmetsp:Transcript_23739/g.26334  ORF Transcript_23739/g.26334 Transcript_23739/m.26334 type:complete len:311 (+) Transcript_23739:380-1312(+)